MFVCFQVFFCLRPNCEIFNYILVNVFHESSDGFWGDFQVSKFFKGVFVDGPLLHHVMVIRGSVYHLLFFNSVKIKHYISYLA